MTEIFDSYLRLFDGFIRRKGLDRNHRATLKTVETEQKIREGFAQLSTSQRQRMSELWGVPVSVLAAKYG